MFSLVLKFVTEVCLRFRVYQFLPESQQSGDRFNVDVNNEYVVKFAAEDTTGNVDQLTLWYSPEVKFSGMLLVRVRVKEEGVEGVRMRMTMNKPAPHEHVAGKSGGILANLPAFE